MNVLRLKEFYTDYYNTNSGPWSKLITRFKPGSVCSYSNHLSSRAVGRSMQRSLKLKLQNALNQAFVDTGSPAIFVGGRRHNRKKRKNKNGQNKKKNKKGGVVVTQALPKTPDFSYYEDELSRYAEPKVSCLDIKEPVFAEHPVKSRLKNEDRDSMYNSSDSLVNLDPSPSIGPANIKSSFTSDQIGDNEATTTLVLQDDVNTTAPPKTGLPRLHSEDSGVFDDEIDDYDEDVGFCDDITVEFDVLNTDERSIQDELSEVTVGDNEVETGETSPLVIVNDNDPTENAQNAAEIKELITETKAITEIIDEFENVTIKPEAIADKSNNSLTGDDEDAALFHLKDEKNDSFEASSNRSIENTDPFLKFANYPEDEEEIVFDLSQLEVNNIDEISKTKDTIQLLTEDQEIPTVLEEEIPLTVPLDLLIDNDDNDQVLFEAKNRKDLSITCNPLYEYTVMEEEDKLSIKSYQSGFKTDFDNINLLQIPVPASDKAAHKSLKESSPLMKRQPARVDRDDELACCVIL